MAVDLGNRDIPRTASTDIEARLRRGAPVELIAILLLALSTLVAVTAVSIGIARADVLHARAPFALTSTGWANLTTQPAKK